MTDVDILLAAVRAWDPRPEAPHRRPRLRPTRAPSARRSVAAAAIPAHDARRRVGYACRARHRATSSRRPTARSQDPRPIRLEARPWPRARTRRGAWSLRLDPHRAQRRSAHPPSARARPICRAGHRPRHRGHRVNAVTTSPLYRASDLVRALTEGPATPAPSSRVSKSAFVALPFSSSTSWDSCPSRKAGGELLSRRPLHASRAWRHHHDQQPRLQRMESRLRRRQAHRCPTRPGSLSTPTCSSPAAPVIAVRLQRNALSPRRTNPHEHDPPRRTAGGSIPCWPYWVNSCWPLDTASASSAAASLPKCRSLGFEGGRLGEEGLGALSCTHGALMPSSRDPNGEALLHSDWYPSLETGSRCCGSGLTGYVMSC